MESPFIIIASGTLVFLIQIVWKIAIKEFLLSDKVYFFIAVIFSGAHTAYLFLTGDKVLPVTCLSVIFMILTDLSFVDWKYFEISGNSYYFLIPPVLLYCFTNGMYPFWACFISCAIMLGVMMLADKIVGIEKIGGADVKLMLITALMFTYYDILILMTLIFAADLVLFAVTFVINKIQTGKNTTRIPMIVAINLAVFLMVILCKTYFYA